LVPEQRARRLRDEYLPAVAGGGDARSSHHVDPEVALVAEARFAGMEPHAHADGRAARPRMVAQPALRVDRRADRVARAWEREEERVALRVDLGPAVRRERLAHDPPVLPRDLGVVVAELLQQLRRAFDVGEGERDGSAGERAHAAYATRVNRLAQETSPYLQQ